MFVQSPSSIIFLVIIGIWAAYFVQYWVRRREHLATIRSVDAFSETMRVLQRRAPLPSVEDGGQSPRTYAVSPARAVRPQVTVKRADAHPTPSVAHDTTAHDTTERHALSAPAAEPEVPTMQPSRATRGAVVLIGLAATLVFGVLAAFGVLLWWSFVVPLMMAVGGFFWLRAGVQAEIKARRAARGRARRAAERGASAPAAGVAAAAAVHAPSQSETLVETASESQVEPVAEQAPAVSARHFELAQEVASAWVPEDAPFDVSASSTRRPEAFAEISEVAVEAVAVESAPPVESPAVADTAVADTTVADTAVDEDDIPLTWEPRPVPRPTYTMKARAAERPAPVAPPEATPVPIDDETAYDDDVPERWIVGG